MDSFKLYIRYVFIFIILPRAPQNYGLALSFGYEKSAKFCRMWIAHRNT